MNKLIKIIKVGSLRASLGLALFGAWSGLQAERPQDRKTVIILQSVAPETPGILELTQAIQAGLRKESSLPVDIYNEYTGLDRFRGPTYESSLTTLFQEKFGARKVDLLITVGPTAMAFAISRHLLPGVPMVTSFVAQRFVDPARLQRPELTGVIQTRNAPKTIDLMLALYPGTRQVDVVLGASQYEREQAAMGRIIFKDFETRLTFNYLNDLSVPQMEARLAKAPEDTLVLFGSLLQDAAGLDFNDNEPLNRLAKASRRPVFALSEEELGSGVLGGVVLSMELLGRATAGLGSRILKGEPASRIPFLVDAGAEATFDARALSRWGVKARSLPPGSVLRFVKPTLWEAHWKTICFVFSIFAIESLLVAGLVIQLRRRKKAEGDLVKANLRYRTVADFTYDWEFWQNPDGSFEYVSPACERVSGYAPGAFNEAPELFEQIVLDKDRDQWKARQTEALAGNEQSSFEYQIRTRDGEVRWVAQSSNPVRAEGSASGGSRGSIQDITARKRGELALLDAYQEIATLKDQLEAENTYYREKIQAVGGSTEILGQSDSIKYLLYRINQVAPSDTTVLIEGETGTGKELVAEAIHKLGARKDRALVKVNCAALPQGLAESELFGHEKGAFTGALSQRKGRFEVADGATLFLDEVGELSPEVQAKLLRVIQEGEFQRVGGDRTLHVDVRIIAATNRSLAKEVAAGRFREDLWYRLNVFPITVPPLAQRKEDIPELAQSFVQNYCHRLNRPVLEFPKAVVQALQAYHWPGNVRELQNVIEQAVLVSEGKQLRLADALKAAPALPKATAKLVTLEEVERNHILKTLEATNWKLEGALGAASLLALKPSTLRSRMLKLNIERA